MDTELIQILDALGDDAVAFAWAWLGYKIFGDVIGLGMIGVLFYGLYRLFKFIAKNL